MRLFIAIELTETARQAIAAEQARVRDALAPASRGDLKWVAPSHMHLTLAFLGEVPPADADALVSALAAPIAVAPFAIRWAGLGVFPRRGPARVLWLALARGAEPVIDLERSVTDRIRRLGLPLEPRPFHPHVTLARWRKPGTPAGLSILDADRGAVIAEMRVDRVSLIHSRLSPSGSVYIQVCQTRLGDSVVPPLQS